MADFLVLTLDCNDLDVQRAFWTAALGYIEQGGVGQYLALVDPQGMQPKLLLQQVDEPKGAKNRLHLDLHVADVEGEAQRLEALGATRVQRVEEFGIYWVLLRDPEGNEFCIVPTESAVS
jgi:catechol 2,3-dioxygenase-like lactoylglutathione lyase family enzyme